MLDQNNGGGAVVAILHDIETVAPSAWPSSGKSPVVEDQKLDARQALARRA
jgi:hypothetical protein